MNIKKLVNLTADELIDRIQASRALDVFAKQRAKFEGWLKVELIDILIKQGIEDAVPEHGLIDVSFGKVAIELKTVNTNYRDGLSDNKGKPITKNVQSVIRDVQKHRENDFPHKYIIFVVFPLNDLHHKWLTHLDRIETELGSVCSSRSFTFKKTDDESSSISGRLYYGKVIT